MDAKQTTSRYGNSSSSNSSTEAVAHIPVRVAEEEGEELKPRWRALARQRALAATLADFFLAREACNLSLPDALLPATVAKQDKCVSNA